MYHLSILKGPDAHVATIMNNNASLAVAMHCLENVTNIRK